MDRFCLQSFEDNAFSFNGDIYTLESWDGERDHQGRPHGGGVLVHLVDAYYSDYEDEDAHVLTEIRDIYQCVVHHGVMCGAILVHLSCGGTRFATCDTNGLLHGFCVTMTPEGIVETDAFYHGNMQAGTQVLEEDDRIFDQFI